MTFPSAFTDQDVIFCYQILLGRDPENHNVIQDKLDRLSDLRALIEEFVVSPEFSSKQCLRRRQHLKISSAGIQWVRQFARNGEPGGDEHESAADHLARIVQRCLAAGELLNLPKLSATTNIVVLGNCQTDTLVPLLSQTTGCRVSNIREHALTDPHPRPSLVKQVDQADLIISQPLNAGSFGPFATRELAQHKTNLLVIPSFYFSGLHPDIIYMGHMGERYVSPIGDYHSAIAVAAFQEGLGVQETSDLYQEGVVFAEAGLFDEWQNSLDEFRSRNFFCHIDMCDDLAANLVQQPLFYSINHPSLHLMSLLTRKIMARISHDQGWTPFVRDDLQNNVIYPVWKPIAEHHGLGFRSPESFFLPTSRGGGRLSLYEFLKQSFSMYRHNPPANIRQPDKVERIRQVIRNRFSQKLVADIRGRVLGTLNNLASKRLFKK